MLKLLLVPSSKLNMHGKLYNPYYSYSYVLVPEGGRFEPLILRACVAEKELQLTVCISFGYVLPG